MKDQVVPSNSPAEGSPATSLSLLQRACLGDGLAWDDIVRLYGPLILRWCRWRGVQDADAKDIAQMVFCQVLKHLGDFRKTEPGHSFRRWLKAIVSNAITDCQRAAKRQPIGVGGSHVAELFDLVLAPPGAASQAEENDEGDRTDWMVIHLRALDLLVDQFEPRTLEMYRKVKIERLAPRAVAAALGATPGAVYVAVSRVRRSLMEILHHLEGAAAQDI